MQQIPFTDPRFKIHNSISPTFSPTISKDGESCTIRTEKEGDWWSPGGGVHRQNGAVFGFVHPVGKEGLEVCVELGVEYVNQYDQAALFLKAGDVWVKAGLEYDNDKLWAGCVVTNPYSDWSIQPAPSQAPGSKIKMTISLKSHLLQIYLGEDMIRQVTVFGDSEKVVTEVLIGVMGCSPKGEGVSCWFGNFGVKEGGRD